MRLDAQAVCEGSPGRVIGELDDVSIDTLWSIISTSAALNRVAAWLSPDGLVIAEFSENEGEIAAGWLLAITPHTPPFDGVVLSATVTRRRGWDLAPMQLSNIRRLGRCPSAALAGELTYCEFESECELTVPDLRSGMAAIIGNVDGIAFEERQLLRDSSGAAGPAGSARAGVLVPDGLVLVRQGPTTGASFGPEMPITGLLVFPESTGRSEVLCLADVTGPSMGSPPLHFHAASLQLAGRLPGEAVTGTLVTCF